MNPNDELLIEYTANLLQSAIGISLADMKRNLQELYEHGMLTCDIAAGRCRITPEGLAAIGRVPKP